jgi:RNA polymerase sigma-70 factor (ECF subfamily)
MSAMPAGGPISPFLSFFEPFTAVARTSLSMTAIQEPPERADKPASEEGCRVPDPIAANAFDLANLVQKHQAGVWRYVRFLGADASEADDLTQETFLALARAEFVERDERQTAGYLRVVARNQLLALRRKQNREVSTVELEAADSVWAAAAGPDGSLGGYLEALRDCVQQLEGRARQAIELHYHDQAGREAIATRLEMQPDGVKTLLRRTRQVLRECVERKLKTETNL